MYTCIGLMSGTSRDGVDAALIRTDGEQRLETGAFLCIPYSHGFRRLLQDCLKTKETIPQIEKDLTYYHIEAVHRLIKLSDQKKIDLIGFHGHTLLHQPEKGLTWQIGDSRLLANKTKIPVISCFRVADMAVGGQGAPLVPLFHRALLTKLEVEYPVGVLNIGGIANVTWVGKQDLLAFDSGPGNALLDDWMEKHTSTPLDYNGQMAAKGRVDEILLQTLKRNSFLKRRPPKSLDRQTFDLAPFCHLEVAEGAATITEFTAVCIEESLRWFPERPSRWLVSGGGRYNRTLMTRLQKRLGVSVESIEVVGGAGDVLEAQAFGFLAVRSVLGLPLTLPSTTGVTRPMSGGQKFEPL